MVELHWADPRRARAARHECEQLKGSDRLKARQSFSNVLIFGSVMPYSIF